MFAFGLAQAAAILGAFYALARRLLPALPPCLATAVVAAIGFSGTAYNFVLPHTNSATFGILFLLLMLLALASERLILAGLAGGVVCLTRPEYAAIAALTCAAFLVGRARDRGMRDALRAVPSSRCRRSRWPEACSAIFAGGGGRARAVLREPVAGRLPARRGFGAQQTWAPFDVASVASTLARAGVYCGAARRPGRRRVRFARSSRRARGALLALWPLAAVARGCCSSPPPHGGCSACSPTPARRCRRSAATCWSA